MPKSPRTAQRTTTADNPALGLALVMAALAGWIDAAGLTDSAGIFILFMSGNTTSLAVALTHGNWINAGVICLVLALFVVGVTVGELLEQQTGRPLVLALEALFLAAGARHSMLVRTP